MKYLNFLLLIVSMVCFANPCYAEGQNGLWVIVLVPFLCIMSIGTVFIGYGIKGLLFC